MRPAPRPVRAPDRALAAVAGIVAVSGAAILGVPDPTPDRGLTPRTVLTAITAALPPDARDVRVNGLYGSGHAGTWQFTAHLTWRSPDGTVHGGTTELPNNAGAPLDTSRFDRERLTEEEARGLTLPELRSDLADASTTAPLALVDAETPTGQPAVVTVCAARSAATDGTCVSKAGGRPARRIHVRLTDTPALQALSVQRADAPVVTP